ncbi:FAD-binding oxidoreductase [Acanthopleuribacter pedis]|uniref:FAD-binding oxidoreductase n=1 Tax=Acanthopleuribacter pedis TaxID=442870 RepID=A0A8J7QPS3_9BACT|nr:FAD-binding oxidoreductase [Acanthopleuribacter pedis]MBO1321880.1 FAD-binding oxidoreductase [Acanthopleuribacter pedis]
MRRWNGWGDDKVDFHLSGSAQGMLEELIGSGTPREDVDLAGMLAKIPASRLPDHPLVDREPLTRLRHAVGQSFPDWVQIRYGDLRRFPDGVAFPNDDREVGVLLRYAAETEARVIPYGGGTSVVGHLTTPKGDQPVLMIATTRLNQLQKLDRRNYLATFGAGVNGPDLEAALRAEGFTLGHYPQSFEYSTLGGWVAARSSGQQSLGYGRIEDMFAGGRMYTPTGIFDMNTLPASAAGPDLRHMVLGSEGRMGVISEATVRIRRLPEAERFHAVFFPDWTLAEQAVREVSQAGVPLSMMRLSNAMETQTNLALAGKERLINGLKQYLELRRVNVADQGCMLIIGFTGARAIVKAGRRKALELCRRYRGVHMYRMLGEAWRKNRFRTPYARNELWRLGYGVDTLETCVHWDVVGEAMAGIEAALRNALNVENEAVHVFTHLSHFYSSGCSIYTTYLFRLPANGEAAMARWRRLKEAASEQIVKYRGTISHQHGVGEDHQPYLVHEKTPLGIDLIKQNCAFFDPKGMMNPGKLV